MLIDITLKITPKMALDGHSTAGRLPGGGNFDRLKAETVNERRKGMRL